MSHINLTPRSDFSICLTMFFTKFFSWLTGFTHLKHYSTWFNCSNTSFGFDTLIWLSVRTYILNFVFEVICAFIEYLVSEYLDSGPTVVSHMTTLTSKQRQKPQRSESHQLSPILWSVSLNMQCVSFSSCLGSTGKQPTSSSRFSSRVVLNIVLLAWLIWREVVIWKINTRFDWK